MTFFCSIVGCSLTSRLFDKGKDFTMLIVITCTVNNSLLTHKLHHEQQGLTPTQCLAAAWMLPLQRCDCPRGNVTLHRHPLSTFLHSKDRVGEAGSGGALRGGFKVWVWGMAGGGRVALLPFCCLLALLCFLSPLSCSLPSLSALQ